MAKPRVKSKDRLSPRAAKTSGPFVSRGALEAREEGCLASYAMKSSLSRGRAHPEQEHPYRTAFQRDRDRVIHSTAFRRLQYKTQVFVNHEGDYYRTRLTHSMEASQISRTLARALGLNEDLCECLALAHDLGHTPFGHSGEDALKECMKAIGGFNHNAQSLRIVEILERRYPGFPGLNLTWEVRESLRKHPTKDGKPVEAAYKPEWGCLLEAQIVDNADSIAYDSHDIDDGLKAGLIHDDEMQSVGLWRQATEWVRKNLPDLAGDVFIYQRVLYIINAEVTDLVTSTHELLSRNRIDNLEAVRAAKKPMVVFSPKMAVLKAEMQTFLFSRLYRHYRVVRMAEKAKRFVTELFREFVRKPEQLPPRFQAWTSKVGLLRGVADYIAGMTDRYAQEEYMKLFHPFERV